MPASRGFFTIPHLHLLVSPEVAVAPDVVTAPTGRTTEPGDVVDEVVELLDVTIAPPGSDATGLRGGGAPSSQYFFFVM